MCVERGLMKRHPMIHVPLYFIAILPISAMLGHLACAQSAELQQRVAQLKQAAADNKQALAHYAWQQQEMTAVKGNVKDTKVFQVHIGPDGRPQKVEPQNTPASTEGGGGRIKHHIVEKKKEEYEQYGQQIGSLPANRVAGAGVRATRSGEAPASLSEWKCDLGSSGHSWRR